MSLHQISLKFPKTRVRFDETDLSFAIYNIKSREPSVVYFKLHLFDMGDREIYYDDEVKYVDDTDNVAYTSDKWIIGTEYSLKHTEFSINGELVERTSFSQIEMILIGIDSENPLYFNKAMFKQGEFGEYHKPLEVQDSQLIQMNKNIYANLFDKDDNFLQVIRPVGNKNFKTDCLIRNECTVLAPHLNNESDLDNPTNLMVEFVNQTEQTITIQK